jgi:hypothetical protein
MNGFLGRPIDFPTIHEPRTRCTDPGNLRGKNTATQLCRAPRFFQALFNIIKIDEIRAAETAQKVSVRES